MRNEVLKLFDRIRRHRTSIQIPIKRMAFCVGACCAVYLASMVLTAAAEPPPRWGHLCESGMRVARAFERPATKYSAGHRGVDLPLASCPLVLAPASGTVTFSGMVVDRPLISVRTDVNTIYSIEAIETELKAGDAVRAGETLGKAVKSSHCVTGCVHFGVRVAGEYVNPLWYFFTRPVLLPW